MPVPFTTCCDPDAPAEAIRLAVRDDIPRMGLTQRQVANEAHVLPGALERWVDNPRAWTPQPLWLHQVRGAVVRLVRPRAQEYLAAWDAEGYAAFLAQRQAAHAGQMAEMERRLAAAGQQ